MIINSRLGRDMGISKMTFRNNSVFDYLLTTIDSFKLLNEFKVVDLDRLYSDGYSLLEYTIKTKQQKYCTITHDKNFANWDDEFSNIFKIYRIVL